MIVQHSAPVKSAAMRADTSSVRRRVDLATGIRGDRRIARKAGIFAAILLRGDAVPTGAQPLLRRSPPGLTFQTRVID